MFQIIFSITSLDFISFSSETQFGCYECHILLQCINGTVISSENNEFTVITCEKEKKGQMSLSCNLMTEKMSKQEVTGHVHNLIL